MNNPIETLIRFVLDHIYLVFIVGGVIWSLLSRLAKPGQTQPGPQPNRPRPSNSMPDFGGGGMQKPNRPSIPDRPIAAPAAPGQPETMRPASAGPQGRTVEAYPSGPVYAQELSSGEGVSSERPGMPSRERPDYAAMRASMDQGKGMDESPGFPEIVDHEEANVIRAADLTSEDIRKAVLWAEILGPPRSRKPHQR